jgi:hypothetical protein
MTEAKPAADKSPEELRAELSARRAELGDTVEELAHRVDVPAQVKEKKAETVAKLQDAKAEALHRVQESTAKVKAAIADKAPVVTQKVDQAKAVYADKAPPAVQAKVDQAVTRSKAVYADKAPVVQGHVNRVVAGATPVVQEKVGQARAVYVEKAPPAVQRTLDQRPGLVAGVAGALVVLLIGLARRTKKKKA